jgi:methionyl-tRNA synthetase
MPETSQKIYGVLGYQPGTVWSDELVWGNKLAGKKVAETAILFPRPEKPVVPGAPEKK